MKTKELQHQIDYLIECVKDNPNTELDYELIKTRHFSMVFKYFYNEIYGYFQTKIRFYCELHPRNIWCDYVPINTNKINAYKLYEGFKEYIENEINIYKEDTVLMLRSGAVRLNRKELK